MLSKSPHAESLLSWAAGTKNRSYSGFYCAPDFERKTGLSRCAPYVVMRFVQGWKGKGGRPSRPLSIDWPPL